MVWAGLAVAVILSANAIGARHDCSVLMASSSFNSRTRAMAGFLGLFEFTTARWISWAIGDFSVKMLVALTLLFPYRLLLHVLLGNRLQST